MRITIICGLFLFFKQKTAYEMRISDWSSDVCSSDLRVDILESELLQEHRSVDADQVERQVARFDRVEIERRGVQDQFAARKGPAPALDANAIVAQQSIFDRPAGHRNTGIDLGHRRDLRRRGDRTSTRLNSSH